jgi:hypothetical protein
VHFLLRMLELDPGRGTSVLEMLYFASEYDLTPIEEECISALCKDKRLIDSEATKTMCEKNPGISHRIIMRFVGKNKKQKRF